MNNPGQYLEAFVLGNGAILTNVCVLPLYPGLIAFMAGNANRAPRRGQALLGSIVLAGVLSIMTALGLMLYLLHRSFSSILDWFFPAAYGIVIVLGIATIAGRNPFAQLSVSTNPLERSPFAGAFLYGVMLGPMTLPCIGPLVISAFVLGAGSASSLAEGLFYFLAFGLGFGWPLVVLPMVAVPVQRRTTSWLSDHSLVIGRLSGSLLIVIGLAGLWTDVRPNISL